LNAQFLGEPGLMGDVAVVNEFPKQQPHLSGKWRMVMGLVPDIQLADPKEMGELIM